MTTTADLDVFLRSERYRRCADAWIERCGVRFHGDDSAVEEFLLPEIVDELAATGVGLTEIDALLDDDAFHDFLDAKARLDDVAVFADDDVYPHGSAPGRGELPEVTEDLGYTRSTIVTYALWYLLARSSTAALSAHLKAIGITGPVAFARQIVALLPPAP